LKANRLTAGRYHDCLLTSQDVCKDDQSSYERADQEWDSRHALASKLEGREPNHRGKDQEHGV
jgi:hypothetical protein